MPNRSRKLTASGTLSAVHEWGGVGVPSAGWIVRGSAWRTLFDAPIVVAELGRRYGSGLLPVATLSIRGGQTITQAFGDWQGAAIDWSVEVVVDEALTTYDGPVTALGAVSEVQASGLGAVITEFLRAGAAYTLRLGGQVVHGTISAEQKILTTGGYEGTVYGVVSELLTGQTASAKITLTSTAVVMGQVIADPSARTYGKDYRNVVTVSADFSQGLKLTAYAGIPSAGFLGGVYDSQLRKRISTDYRLRGRLRTPGGDYPAARKLMVATDSQVVGNLTLQPGVDVDQTFTTGGQYLVFLSQARSPSFPSEWVHVQEFTGSSLRCWLDSADLAAAKEGGANQVYAALGPVDLLALTPPSSLNVPIPGRWVYPLRPGGFEYVYATFSGGALQINDAKKYGRLTLQDPLSPSYTESFRYLELEVRGEVAGRTLDVQINNTQAPGIAYKAWSIVPTKDWTKIRIDLCVPVNPSDTGLARRQPLELRGDTPSRGTFTLFYQRTSDGRRFETAPIRWNPTAADVQSALRAIGAGLTYSAVTCSGGDLPGSPIFIDLADPTGELLTAANALDAGQYVCSAISIGDEQDSRYPLAAGDVPQYEGSHWGVNRINQLAFTFSDTDTFELRAIRLVADETRLSCMSSEHGFPASVGGQVVYRYVTADTDGRRSLELLGSLAQLAAVPADLARRPGWAGELLAGVSDWKASGRVSDLAGGGYVERADGSLERWVERVISGRTIVPGQARASFVVAPPNAGDVLFDGPYGGPVLFRIRKVLRGIFSGIAFSPSGAIAGGADVSFVDLDGSTAGSATSGQNGAFSTGSPGGRDGRAARVVGISPATYDRHVRRFCPRVQVSAIGVDLASGDRAYWLVASHPGGRTEVWRAFGSEFPLERIADLATLDGTPVVGAQEPALCYWRSLDLITITYNRGTTDVPEWVRQVSYRQGADWLDPVVLSTTAMHLREVFLERTSEVATFRTTADRLLVVDIHDARNLRFIGTFPEGGGIGGGPIDDGVFGAVDVLDQDCVDVTFSVSGQPLRYRSYHDARTWVARP